MGLKEIRKHIKMSNNYRNHRTRYWIAVGLAFFLLVGSGAGYQLLAARYARASNSIPIPPGTLTQLPLHIGNWEGTEVPMDERVIQATDTDDHVNRRYTRGRMQDAVALWVAYGVRFRDLMPHRPEVCYTGSGWTLDDTKSLELKTPEGFLVPCRLLRFHRGNLKNERIIVLNYYLVDGEYSKDVSAVRKRVWRFNSGLQYVTQVQISCSETPWQRAAEKLVCDFAAESAEPIRVLLDKSVAAAQSSVVATTK